MSFSTNFPGGQVRSSSKGPNPAPAVYIPDGRTSVLGASKVTVLRSTSPVKSIYSLPLIQPSAAQRDGRAWLLSVYRNFYTSFSVHWNSHVQRKIIHSFLPAPLQNRLSDELRVTVTHQILDFLHSFTVIFTSLESSHILKWNWNLIWKWNWQNLAVYRTICNY
jgi:hypothetical protein